MDSRDHDRRIYAEVATQTSPITSPLIAPACPASPVTNYFTVTGLNTPDQSCCTATEKSQHENSPVSAAEDTPSGEPSEISVVSSRLPSLPSSFEISRYTSARLSHQNNRTVSLPQVLCDEDLRDVLSQLIGSTSPGSREQSRVVSMPASADLYAQHSTSPDTLAYRESTESSLQEGLSDDTNIAESIDSPSNSSTPSTPRTVVVHSLSSDRFHTPSPPPSSCDSVEFTLEDPTRLPNSFLYHSISPPRSVNEAVIKAASWQEDDGWITWANSPPRPIPALHGPSSLPYARCPSGAEGTIIDEPSSLSRMIWGLDPNDAVPAPHVPQSQQSRAVPIKPPSDRPRQVSLQVSASISSMPTTLVPPHVGSSSRNMNADCCSLGGLKIEKRRSVSMPTRLGSRSEETCQNASRGMSKSGAGLGLSVIEEPLRLENRYERGMGEASPMESSHFYGMRAPNALDGDIGMLSVQEQTENHHLPEIQRQDERYRHQSHGTGPQEHPSNLVELLSSPVQFPVRSAGMNFRLPSVAPRRPASDFTSTYLPTPPSSSSPQWSSVLSPARNKRLSTLSSSHHGNNSSTNVKICGTNNSTNDELSEELRRFVFTRISPVSSVNAADVPRVPQIPYAYPIDVYSPEYNVYHSLSTEHPAHPPGLPIPHHILLSQTPEPSSLMSSGSSSSSPAFATPSSSPYTRSTLSNPRSIPLSRLRQKRGAVKLATVLEEDSAEPHAHDGRLAPPVQTPLRLSLRTPSPLDDKLHAQSIDEKVTSVEELKLGEVRVKLPHRTTTRTENIHRTSLDLDQSETPQGSPKKKRLQRRRKHTTSKLAETGKGGFPLVAGGTVSFGSMSSFTKDTRKEEAGLPSFVYAPSGTLQTVEKAVLGRNSDAVRCRD